MFEESCSWVVAVPSSGCASREVESVHRGMDRGNLQGHLVWPLVILQAGWSSGVTCRFVLRFQDSSFDGVLFPRETQLRLGHMKKQRFLSIMGLIGLFLAGCSGGEEPELALMNDEQVQTDVPVHVAESEHIELENMTYVGEGEGFSVFAARDRDDNWCVLLNVEPPANSPDDWAVTSSCASSEDFAVRGVWVQSESLAGTYTAQLLPDNFTGEIDPDLERINNNLAAK